MDNLYCVYCHINLVNNKKYIGITKQRPQDRWRENGKGYQGQTKFWNAIKKYGWDNFEHIILFTNLTLEEANYKEKELIDYFDTIKNGYNVSSGGSPTIHSIQTIQKIHNSMIGKKHSEQTKRLISQTKSKLYGKKVQCVETQQIYETLTIAEQLTGIDKSSILRVCKGKQITAGGFHWIYIDNLDYAHNKKDKRKKMVKCLTTGKIYNSVAEAAKATNSDASNICKVCNGKYKTTNKLSWEWLNNE